MGFESVQFLPEGLDRILTVKFYVAWNIITCLRKQFHMFINNRSNKGQKWNQPGVCPKSESLLILKPLTSCSSGKSSSTGSRFPKLLPDECCLLDLLNNHGTGHYKNLTKILKDLLELNIFLFAWHFIKETLRFSFCPFKHILKEGIFLWKWKHSLDGQVLSVPKDHIAIFQSTNIGDMLLLL